jgi:LPXTG-site transpeptidase (sortase) family protein
LFLAAACFVAIAALNTWLMAQDRFLVANEVAPHALMVMTRTVTPASQAVLSQSPPVQIRIPAIGVERAIIELSPVLDPRTGIWVRDVQALFRSGREDLVGHWGGTAYPGDGRNVVLVGHNYGYRHQGVFLRLGRLKLAQEVHVANSVGQVFVYRVSSIERLDWRRRDSDELLQHSSRLAAGDSERLTLVTCAGPGFAPFAERIYVIADPVY